jgi:LmbE family N-acetylglucosaminyl deacetylase
MNIVVFGAHPDDCEFFAGGTAIKFVRSGHRVKFVSLTNGDRGHMSLNTEKLARIRHAEAEASAKVLGVSFDILDIHDCHLVPDVATREHLVGIIRKWQADIVICHRPNDYHPDHRYTGVLVQDTAFLVTVPLFCPEVSPLRKNPIYMYFQDQFTSPEPFRPDVIVPIDDVYEEKIEALHCMSSQFYEWLPWIVDMLDDVPSAENEAERKQFLKDFIRPHLISYEEELKCYYGEEVARHTEVTEAFQLCEYGLQPSTGELHALFPGLPPRIDI